MKIFVATLLVSILLLSSCSKSEAFYSLEDFKKVKKIDSHIHVTTKRDAFVEQAKDDNFRLLNIVVDESRGEAWIKKQYDYSIDQINRHPENYMFATSFSIENWDDPDWLEHTLKWLNKNIDEGAVAVKIWKNIGMVFKDKNGSLIMMDDPRFESIFTMLAERKVAVIGHLGEPKNCWLPIDSMTVNNDKEYFKEHPEYHMYNFPDLPSYEDQIAARDRVLQKHPDLIFVGAHMGSMSWSVDELAKRLDAYPQMAVDLAARIGQILYQTIDDREKVRDFFIQYQDRLIYASDLSDEGEDDANSRKAYMHKTWLEDWRFFVTDDLMTNPRVNDAFNGLKLPQEVVDKIYFKNCNETVTKIINIVVDYMQERE